MIRAYPNVFVMEHAEGCTFIMSGRPYQGYIPINDRHCPQCHSDHVIAELREYLGVKSDRVGLWMICRCGHEWAGFTMPMYAQNSYENAGSQ